MERNGLGNYSLGMIATTVAAAASEPWRDNASQVVESMIPVLLSDKLS